MIFWPTGNRRFWGSGRPRAAGIPSKKLGGEAPPSFWKASRPPGAAQIPKVVDFRSARKSCRAAQKPFKKVRRGFKKVGGKVHHLFKGFLGRPGPPRTPKRPIFHQITNPPLVNPPFLVPPACDARGPLVGYKAGCATQPWEARLGRWWSWCRQTASMCKVERLAWPNARDGYPRSVNSASPKTGNYGASGAGQEGPGVDFCMVFYS